VEPAASQEIGELESAVVAVHFVPVADGVLTANLPVVAGRRLPVVDRILDQPELELSYPVELAETDPVAGDETPQCTEQLAWKRLLALGRRELFEELKHVLEIGRPEPLHAGSKDTTNVTWTPLAALWIISPFVQRKRGSSRGTCGDRRWRLPL
jgi:hypothetical protein